MKKLYKKAILLILTVSMFTYMNSQSMDAIEKKGDEAYYGLDLSNAIKNYKKANESNPNNPRIVEKLAKAYLMNDNNSKEAMNLYSTLAENGSASNVALLNYAKLLSANNQFSEATKIYNKLNPKLKLDDNFLNQLSTPNASIKLKNELALNTVLSDFSPMFYKDGISFVSTRKKRDNIGWEMKNNVYEYYTDAFYSQKSGKSDFSAAKNLINNKNENFMTGPMTFTKDYGIMFVTRSNAIKTDVQKASDKRTVNLKIYRVNYTGDVNNWTEISELPLNKSANAADYSYAHPALTPDDNSMVFASNMPGGLGGTDLWIVHKQGNDWSTPENLGPNINTAGEEKFPYVAKDGTLYYASDGLPGIGGLDIFKATENSGVYSNPTNLGNPINSKMDDFGFIIDKDNKSGYLTSNRMNTGLGEDDIYSWASSEINLTVNVIDKLTGLPIPNSQMKISCLDNKMFTSNEKGSVVNTISPTSNCNVVSLNEEYKPATLNLKNINTSRIVNMPLEKLDKFNCIKMQVIVLDKATNLPIDNANVHVSQKTGDEKLDGITNQNGILDANCNKPDDLYTVTASKDNGDGSKYIAKTEEISTRGKTSLDLLKLYIYLDKGRIGETFRIDNIYYDLNKWNIRPDAAVELDKIVNMLYDNPAMNIELGSHTDCRSSVQYNLDLSDKRAQSATQYIVSKGIENSRITGKGYGESMLINGCACEGAQKSNCSELEHQKNRRTEFKILKF